MVCRGRHISRPPLQSYNRIGCRRDALYRVRAHQQKISLSFAQNAVNGVVLPSFITKNRCGVGACHGKPDVYGWLRGFAMANPYIMPIYPSKWAYPTPFMGFRWSRQVVHRLPYLYRVRAHQQKISLSFAQKSIIG